MPARYRIEIKATAAREIRAIGQSADRRRVVERIGALADDPRPAGCTKLSGREAYRFRQGDYRILYTIAADVLVVEVVRGAHRSEAYR